MNQFSFLISMNKQQRRRGMVAAGLAGVAIMVFTAAAGASPIRFDNPAHGDTGHFHWPEGPDDYGALDITLDASAQPGVVGGPATFEQKHQYQRGDNNQAFLRGASGVNEFEAIGWLLVPHDAGDPIPSGAPFNWGGRTYALWLGGTLLPAGVPTYLGVRFNGPDWQYGWIGGVLNGWIDGDWSSYQFDAFAWGYETEVGVPIAAGVPEPSTLALLACGLIGLLCYVWRKRR